MTATQPHISSAFDSGAIEIGRHPGVVQVTFLVPVERLEKIGLLEIAARQYPTE